MKSSGSSFSPMLLVTPPVPHAAWRAEGLLSRARWIRSLVGLFVCSMVVMLIGLSFGNQSISFGDGLHILLKAFGGTGVDAEHDPTSAILLQVRLPRVLLAYCVGAALGAVGAVLQALLRNPLADPYVLGISSGATLGAALAIYCGGAVVVAGISTLPLFAMLGGLLVMLLVYRIAATSGGLPVHTLLLTGVIFNAICSALVMFLSAIMEPNRSYGLLSWLMGTLTAPSGPVLSVIGISVGLGLLVLVKHGQVLNILTVGEDMAATLGVEVERVKRTVFAVASVMTGLVVAVSGMIGFVGMMVPHAVRAVSGSDHRLLVPASAFVGGMFLVLADLLARTLAAPNEIPVGVLTALVGGPFFLYLLATRKGVGV